MKLTADFNSLWTQVRRITDNVEEFDLHGYIKEVDPIDVQLSEGLEVSLDELGDVGGLFEYKGRQVLLYIPDQGSDIEKVLSGRKAGRKFHLCDCITLKEMRARNRYNRYFATTDLSGNFTVTGNSRDRKSQLEGKAELDVCINCLKRLNFKDAKILPFKETRNIRDNFNIKQFFETYSSCFPYLPKQKNSPTDKTGYTDDWAEISAKKRNSVKYICEECNVDLSSNKRLLHVHHMDGQKGNNTRGNLKALCVSCHGKQPMHQSMYVKHEDRMLLTRLRNQQSLINTGWDDALKYVDPAMKGVLSLYKSQGWIAPEIGFEVMDEGGRVVAELEAAWEHSKKGFYIRDVDKKLLPDWELYSLTELINELERI